MRPEELAKQAKKIAEEMIKFSELLDGNQPAPKSQKPEVKKPNPGIYYDDNPASPNYNPPPPFAKEPPPPRNRVRFNEIMKGQIFICTGCGRSVLRANRDIKYDQDGNMLLKQEYLDILIDGVQWPESLTVRKHTTGKAIDCLVCDKIGGLWLVGSPPPQILKEGATSI